MSAQEIYQWWYVWLVIGGVIVVAVLLDTILKRKHRT